MSKLLVLTSLFLAHRASAAGASEFTCIANWIGGLDCGVSGRCEYHESNAEIMKDTPWFVTFSPTGGTLRRPGGDSRLSLLFKSGSHHYYRVHDRKLGDDLMVWHQRQRKLFFTSYSDGIENGVEKLSNSYFAYNCVSK